MGEISAYIVEIQVIAQFNPPSGGKGGKIIKRNSGRGAR
jgi:hypothetical protein